MSNKPLTGSRGFLLLLILLLAAIVVLFHNSFVPGKALFSNDGPLGIQFSRPYAMPQGMFGVWVDETWVGMYNGTYVPNFTSLIFSTLGPMGRVNFYAPLSVLIIGVCAWLFFRRMGCNARVAILASIAAALNSNYFSNACWGLPSRGYALAAMFLALAAIETGVTVQPLLTAILAGFAVGLSITEGGDNGAILSIFVGSYALWRTWIAYESRGKAAVLAVAKGALMVICAGIFASATIGVFMRTAVTGMVGTAQDAETKQQAWDRNTMWSLPKLETLRVIIPGVFGYRMNDGTHGVESSYWGSVAENPIVDELKKRLNDPDPNVQRQVAAYLSNQYIWRSSGAGEYAGVLVVLVAIWAVIESLRKKNPIFTITERKIVWFWAAMAVVAMLFGWGRHAAFYKIIYALPYFSTIRNPMKFFHALHLCLMVLFALGLLGLNRRYLDVTGKPASLLAQFKLWWAKGPAHERLWTWGCTAALVVSVVAWLGYISSRSAVVKHLMIAGFPDQDTATLIAKFSGVEVFLFIVFLAASVAAVTLIISGGFSGKRARWGGVMLGALLLIDLARANMPWVIYYDWKSLYASNTVLETLRDKPYEHRVAYPNLQILTQMPDVRNYFMQDQQAFQIAQHMYQVYQGEWVQHQFPYYSIQTLDIAQEPRVPEEKQAYLNAFGGNFGRLWQLTNVRYVLGASGNFVEMLNQKFDASRRRFRTHTAFEMNGLDAMAVTNGRFALIEFAGALPRAQLYNNWEIITNGPAVLSRLADQTWDPAQSVIISDPAAPKPSATTGPAGTAEIISNPSPKLMRIRTKSAAPAMLLLNDKLDPEWHAYIDNKEVPIHRANFLMRGVHVPAGEHEVTFKFFIKPTGFLVVAGCEVVGLILIGIVIWSAKRKRTIVEPTPAAASAR